MAKSGEPTICSEKNRTFIGHLRHSSLKAGNRTFIGHIGHYPGWPNNLRVLAPLREKYVKRKTKFDDKRFESKRTGKSGYQPVCRNENTNGAGAGI